MKTLIVGSGIGGIATSIRLAAKGHEVHVFEQNDTPGGKLSVIEQDGFRFDMGPSLFTMPHFVDELFELAGENPQDHFEYWKVPVACRYFYEDGIDLTAYGKVEEFAAEVEEKLGVEPKILTDYFAHSQKLYELTSKIFLEKSLHKLDTYLSKDVLKTIANFPSLDLMTSMHKANERRLKHPKLVQLFNRFATYNGSSPYQAAGVLNVIPHLEHNIGTFFPKGGMYAIPQSLYKLSLSMGVKYHFSAAVEQILVENQEVKGIQIGEKQIGGDMVVSNMDIVPTYRHLLKGQAQPERILSQERSSSALIFYWGINRHFHELDLHNIFFSQDYPQEFDHIFRRKQVYDDPTVYVNISSKEEPQDAPADCENWFVMINVPYDAGQCWEELIPKVKEATLAKLSRILKTDISQHIVTEDVLDPRLIEKRTSSFLGALYGASSNSRMAAFLRHPNFSSNIKNLYFCGGSVHPGGGIPLCLLSAKIVADLVD